VLSALDPRVTTLVSDAGSFPGVQFCCTTYPVSSLPNQGDRSRGSEQNWAPFYSIAGFVDLYVMGASGSGREELQILNVNDSCCFGSKQWNSIYAVANRNRTWSQQITYYDQLIQAAGANIPLNFQVVEDFTSTSHQISNPFAVNLALNTVLGGASVFGGDPPAVPELSVWELLLLGFMGIGFVRLRKRGSRAFCR
jgi:hypothetical protein